MNLDFNLDTSKKNNTLNTETIYDTIIIGAGPAGLSAALYGKRKGLNIGIIADRIGGQALDTTSVENYLGFNSLSGEKLIQNFENHLSEYDIPISTDTLVASIKNNYIKEITTNNNKIYKSKSIIIATGSKPRMLNIPGEKEYFGKGVAYCAICDGPLFADKNVIVAGGGNSAVEAAIDVSKIASNVKLIHRSNLRADKILIDKLNKLENVEVYLQTQILSVHGETFMTHVKVLNKKENRELEIKSDGLFVEIGYLPNSEVFKDLVKMSENGEIIINSKTETNAKGIYAAGDVANVPYKQIIIATAEGAKAALSANDYINKL